MSAARIDHFEGLYAASDDPWRVRTSWYEQRKRALLLACLHRPRYRHVFEAGCGNGEMSAALAARSARLLAVDGAASAVQAARQRLQQAGADAGAISVEQATLPGDWPAGQQFDLIVISELAYYFDMTGVAALAALARASLAPDGMLVLCHWRHDFADRVSATDAIHAAFDAAAPWRRTVTHLEDAFRLDGWQAAAAVDAAMPAPAMEKAP